MAFSTISHTHFTYYWPLLNQFSFQRKLISSSARQNRNLYLDLNKDDLVFHLFSIFRSIPGFTSILFFVAQFVGSDFFLKFNL